MSRFANNTKIYLLFFVGYRDLKMSLKQLINMFLFFVQNVHIFSEQKHF